MKVAVVFDIDDEISARSIKYEILDENGNAIPITKVNGLKIIPKRLNYLSCYFDPEIRRCQTKTDAFVEGFNTVIDFLNKDTGETE